LKRDAKVVPRDVVSGQAPGDRRALAGTSGKPVGTSGAVFGINGEELRAIRRAWILGVSLISAICVVNVLTIRHDAPHLGTLAPAIWEGSSALVTLVIFAIPAAVALWTIRSSPRWWQAVPVHLVAVLVYSALHVSGFVALRKLAYLTLLHQPYAFGDIASEFPYEFRKDMMAYGLASIIYYLSLRQGARQAAVPVTSPLQATFDIQDGARLVRVAIDDILAVRSAGNYVEFVLVGERRPLMRKPLAAIQSDLSQHGFVRSHRSWLVNRAKVTGLRPEGSGDYAVELGDLEVPLSRRFPEALTALRG
jgi:DNA-binding LytR/AlgR family response regulator